MIEVEPKELTFRETGTLSRSLSPSKRETEAKSHTPQDIRTRELMPDSYQNRAEYEERSKIALQMLRQKDGRIAELEAEMKELQERDEQRCDEINKQQGTIRRLEDENISLKRHIELSESRRPSNHEGELGRVRARYAEEVDELKEKNLDQAEQIEILISELSDMRRLVNDSGHRVHANDEIASLQQSNKLLSEELKSANSKCEELEYELKRLSVGGSTTAHENELYTTKSSLGNDFPPSALGTNAGHDWRDQLNSSAMRLLKERVLRAESEVARLREQEARLPYLAAPEANLGGGEAEEKKSMELGHTVGDALADLDCTEQSTRVDNDKLPSNSTRVGDAHTWWAYVWHEMRNNPSVGVLTSAADENDSSSPHYSNSENQVDHLRGIIRSQAIELTSLRQAQLLHNMHMRKLKEDAALNTEALNREISKLSAHSKAHRQDGEIKISELSKTIQILSKKSDVHQEMIHARDEVIAEKLCAHNLGIELESYRNMLQQEQQKVAQLRKECSELKSLLGSCDIAQSICFVPGFDPSALIELFSGRIMWLQRAVRKRDSDALMSAKPTTVKGSKRTQFGEVQTSDENETLAGPLLRDTESNMEYLPSDIKEMLHRINDPEKLLEVLDVTILSKQIVDQDLQLRSVTKYNDELEQKVAELEIVRSDDVSASPTLEQVMIQNLATQKELEICRRSHSQVRFDLEHSKRTIAENELSLAEYRRELAVLRLNPNRAPTESELNTTEDVPQSSCSKCADVAHTLRERTSQLRIVMESLEALQLNVPKSLSNDGNGRSDPMADVLEFDVHGGPGSWEMEALVKRIIELTTELSSQLASGAMLERKAHSLEEDCLRRQRELNQSRAKLLTMDQIVADVRKKDMSLAEELKRTEMTLVEERATAESRLDELTVLLRDKEYQCQQLQIQLDSAKRQSEVSEVESFRDWFKRTIMSEYSNVSDADKHDIPNRIIDSTAADSIQDLVVTLLVQWREQVGYYPRGAMGPVSKYENKFLQRITDLVVESHSRCMSAVGDANELKKKNRTLGVRLRICVDRLQNCMVYLHRYRLRAEMSERELLNIELRKFECESMLSEYFRKVAADSLKKMRSQAKQIALIASSKSSLQMELQALKADNVSLKSKLLASEDRNEPYYRAREEVYGNMESMLADSERSIHKWVQVELPRLLTGLPITEDAIGISDMDVSLELLGYAADANTAHRESPAHLENRGRQVYALSQALCTIKSSYSLLESRLSVYKDRNFSLRERILELEGLISREEVVAKTHLDSSSIENHESQNTSRFDIDDYISLKDKCSSLEAELMKTQKICDVLEERDSNIRSMVTKFCENEDRLINHASTHISRVRDELHAKFADQLGEITASYELEKIAMTEEIRRLTGAVNGEPFAVGDDETVEETPAKRGDSGRGKSQTHFVGAVDDRKRSLSDTSSSSIISSDHSAAAPSPSHYITNDGPLNIQVAAESGHDMTEAGDPTVEGIPPHNTSAGADDIVHKLRQEMMLDRHRLEQAHAQISELEQLLETQRSAFRRHLSMERDVMVSHSVVGIASSTTSSSREGDSRVVTEKANDDMTLITQSSGENISLEVIVDTAPDESMQLRREPDYRSDGDQDACAQALPKTKDELILVFDCFLHDCEHYMNSCADTPHATQVLLRNVSQLVHRTMHILTGEIDIDVDDVPDEVRVTDAGTQLNASSSDSTGILLEFQERMVDLEEAFNAEKGSITRDWENERQKLISNLDRCRAENESLRLQNGTTVESMRLRYEQSLKDAQDALDDQISASRAEIERLQERVRAVECGPAAQLDGAEAVTEEVAALHSTVRASIEEVEKYRSRLINREKQHGEELRNVWGHFDRFRLSQERMVSSLQNEVSLLGSSTDHVRRDAQLDCEQHQNQMMDREYKRLCEMCRIKQAEMNSVLQVMTDIGAGKGTTDSLSDCEFQASDERGAGYPHMLITKLLQARIDTLDKEVVELHDALMRERERREDGSKINGLVVIARATQTSQSGGDQSSGRRDTDVAAQAEIVRLKESVSELKQQIVVLKEEISRKSKLLSSMRSTRQAESTAVEMWKHEYEMSEEKYKRCSRSLMSKDAIIKDLKERIKVLNSSANEIQDSDGGDVTSLSASELRKRLKSSELERGRARARLNAFRDKIFEMERELSVLREKDDDTKALLEKIEVIKLSNTRKDALIKNQKENLERIQVELLSFKEIAASRESDLEKHNRLLQRHLKESERRNSQLQSQLETKQQSQPRSSPGTRKSEAAPPEISGPSFPGFLTASPPGEKYRRMDPHMGDDELSDSETSGRISANELSNIMSELNVS